MIEGSWEWAIQELRKGRVLTRKSVTGTLKWRIDTLKNGRILSTFDRYVNEETEWESATVFLSDFIATDWIHVKKISCKLKKK